MIRAALICTSCGYEIEIVQLRSTSSTITYIDKYWTDALTPTHCDRCASGELAPRKGQR